MDTDYIYEDPAGLTRDKYEPFIFDMELYIKRYYIFNPEKGRDEFEKKVRSLLYKAVLEKTKEMTKTSFDHAVWPSELEIPRNLKPKEKKRILNVSVT